MFGAPSVGLFPITFPTNNKDKNQDKPTTNQTIPEQTYCRDDVINFHFEFSLRSVASF